MVRVLRFRRSGGKFALLAGWWLHEDAEKLFWLATQLTLDGAISSGGSGSGYQDPGLRVNPPTQSNTVLLETEHSGTQKFCDG
jgi:hypothetical protein